MKRNIFLIVVVLILLVSLITPFLASSIDFGSYLNSSTSLLSSLCSLTTLIIAILLYNKYVIDDIIIEKELDVVLKLKEEFKKLSFNVRIFDGDKSAIVIIRLRNDIKYEKYEKWYFQPLAFSQEYQNLIEPIISLCENSSMMPSKIVEACNKINFIVWVGVDNKDHKYGMVDPFPPRAIITDETYGLLNGKEMTFLEFLELFDNIKKEINQWFKDNLSSERDMTF